MIARQRLQNIAITLESEGALLITATGVHFSPSPRINARSPVGAGDSFLAALVVGMFNGEPLDQALRIAVCAGAAAASGEGTQLVQPKAAADILKLFEHQLGAVEA
jgi:6-phosphofructokinase 2